MENIFFIEKHLMDPALAVVVAIVAMLSANAVLLVAKVMVGEVRNKAITVASRVLALVSASSVFTLVASSAIFTPLTYTALMACIFAILSIFLKGPAYVGTLLTFYLCIVTYLTQV